MPSPAETYHGRQGVHYVKRNALAGRAFLAWHRKRFRLYWRWKSRSPALGRPPIDRAIRNLSRRMASQNPTWGRRELGADYYTPGQADRIWRRAIRTLERQGYRVILEPAA